MNTLAAPMTADDLRLELLAQVIVMGAGYSEALRRVEDMTLADGVKVPAHSTLRGWVKQARASGEARLIRKQWDELQASRRKDADAVNRAEAVRLVLNERYSRKAVGEKLGVHPITVSRWLAEPESVAAMHTEARVSAMLGALSLDDDIAHLRAIAARLEDEGELTAAAGVWAKAAEIEVKRLNGAAKVIVEANVGSVTVASDSAGLGGLADVLRQITGPGGDVVDVEAIEDAEVDDGQED